MFSRDNIHALRQTVELRRILRDVTQPDHRRRLRRLAREIRHRCGYGVPKRQAAELLGISPQALERWVEEGRLPVLRRPGSTREMVDCDALLRVLDVAQALREAGSRRPLGRAFRILDEQGRLLRHVQPNPGTAELRRELEATTPEQRLRELSKLSQSLHRLAAAAAEQRGQAVR